MSAPQSAAGPRRRREPGWDVLRTGFVLLVVLYHSTHLGPALHPDLIPRPRFEFPHQVGASLLLVVSAYFAAATRGRHTAPHYWWGRVSRLLPAFVVAVPIAWLTLRYLTPDNWGDPTVGQLIDNWLMLGNWGTDKWPWLDPAYWTLPLQLMAFTVAALLGASRWGRGTPLRVVLWSALLVPMVLWPLRAGLTPLGEPPVWYTTVVDGLGFHRWHLFVAGIAVWMWSTGRLRTPNAVAMLVLCGFGQFLHTAEVNDEGISEDLVASMLVCIGILLVAVVAHLPRPGSRMPAPLATLFQRLAGISYGVYLIHQTTGYVLMRRLQEVGVGPTLQTVAMLVNALVLGWLLTRLVERPAHRVLMRGYDRFVAARAARKAVSGDAAPVPAEKV
ncbi:acyltransferase family protein [Pseudonocardia phyllosphaerae]|uniref:acyltransferase family protein n=1 Tax=Pseudonocardia phyllosphaerae TaxID=3390502 RepID=UPI00397A0984